MIEFKFTNRNLHALGVRVWRSAEAFTSATLPTTPHAVLAPDATSYIDADVQRGDAFYYMFEAFAAGDAAFSALTAAKALPVLSGPGPQKLIAGDHRLGFYGETPAAELTDGESLASLIGLEYGVAFSSDSPWLKFNDEGRTLFVAKQLLRNDLSQQQIVDVGAAYGEATVNLFGDTYKVRLLTGGDADPATGPGGEWDRYIYRVHMDDPAGTRWASYTNDDLCVGTGYWTWTQEHFASDPDRNVVRGQNDLTGTSKAYPAANAYGQCGWRPVLELIE